MNWTLINAALKKYYGEIWASYLCEYKGLFYIYFPCNGKLHVIHATHPEADWSEPISLDIDGIDPAHIATPKGARYLYFAGGRIVQLAPMALPYWESPAKFSIRGRYRSTGAWNASALEAPKVSFERDITT